MKRLIAVSGLVLLAGCQAPPAEMTEAEIAQIEAEVGAVAEDWVQYYSSEDDLDQYMINLSDWAGAPWPNSWSLDQLRSTISNGWARWDYDLIEQLDTQVRVLAPNVAAVIQRYRETRTDTAGVVQIRDYDDYHVWVLEEANWKMLLAKSKVTTVEES